MTTTPNPGSDAAIALGCTCPVLDNAHGRGYRGRPDQHVVHEGCPVHDRRAPSGDAWQAPDPTDERSASDRIGKHGVF